MSNAPERIIIIGASSGIGRQLASDYAAEGALIVAAARRADKLSELSEAHPHNIFTYPIDVTAPDAEDRFHKMIEMLGGLDTLIYCAGTGFRDPRLDANRLTNTLHTNADGFATIIASAFRYFRDTASAKKGRIAAITSIAGTKGLGVSAAYSATKRFEQVFLEALSQLARMQRVNVSITDIRPGFIRTDLLDSSRSYPMIMTVPYAAHKIRRAIRHRRAVATIDWRWRLLTFMWGLIPRWIWIRLNIDFK